MSNRPELGHSAYRRVREQILAESDVCIWCAHPHADAVDHIVPPGQGGSRKDPDNLAPIHGVDGCPTCGRKCNNEKGDGPLTQRLVTSIDWYAGPT